MHTFAVLAVLLSLHPVRKGHCLIERQEETQTNKLQHMADLKSEFYVLWQSVGGMVGGGPGGPGVAGGLSGGLSGSNFQSLLVEGLGRGIQQQVRIGSFSKD